MIGSAGTVPQHITVQTDYDVVNLRQHIRQLGRDLGLTLIQQTKITTASSTIARGMIEMHHQAMFTIRLSEVAARRALVVICALVAHNGASSRVSIEQAVQLNLVRTLVDEAALTINGHEASLRIHIWLDKTAAGGS